ESACSCTFAWPTANSNGMTNCTTKIRFDKYSIVTSDFSGGSLSDYFEHVVPRVQRHADSCPEWDEGFYPARVFDAADIYSSFPAELLQYLRHLLFCGRIVSAYHHFNILELWIDHLRVRDSVETLHDLCGWKLALDALAERVGR